MPNNKPKSLDYMVKPLYICACHPYMTIYTIYSIIIFNYNHLMKILGLACIKCFIIYKTEVLHLQV
jgi:hypothetical protein